MNKSEQSQRKTKTQTKLKHHQNRKYINSDFETARIGKIRKGFPGHVINILYSEKKVGFIMAMKVVEKKRVNSDKMLEQLISEIKIQNYLCHPNVIAGYGYF